MANIRTLKKDINYVMGDIIEAAYLYQVANPKGDASQADSIVDEAIESFDQLIARVNKRGVEDKKQHFKSVQKDLEVKANELVDKINAL